MKKIVLVVMCSLFAQTAMADLLGLTNGRLANLDSMADLSAEGGVNVGGDGRLFGARVNYKVSPDLMAFGDIGLLTIDGDGVDANGPVYGFGAFYQLRDVSLLENTDFAVKVAYHLGTLDADRGSDIDYSEISIEGLISGEQLGKTEFGWYANVGMHIVAVDFGSTTVFVPGEGNLISDRGYINDNEFLLGAGINGPLSFGEFYAGFDIIDGALLVAGVRYNL